MHLSWYSLVIFAIIALLTLIGYGLLRWYIPDFFRTCRCKRPIDEEDVPNGELVKRAESRQMLQSRRSLDCMV